jgi:hypothetical protein
MARAQRDLPCALSLPAVECLTLRPIIPDDSDVLQAYVRGLSPESRYNRFFGALQELPPAELERVTHLDRRYDLALVAETDVGAASVVIGEARHAARPICPLPRDYRNPGTCNGVFLATDHADPQAAGTLLQARKPRILIWDRAPLSAALARSGQFDIANGRQFTR